jgi:hypothetical protein
MFTLGMATYDDFEGLFFSVQSARMFHPEITEIIILDNNPTSIHGKFNKDLTHWQSPGVKLRHIEYTEKKSTSNRSKIFDFATNEHVIIADSHVLFFPNSIKALKDFYLNDHKPYDFVQGPMMYDDLKSYATHLDPIWRSNFYGVWATKESKDKYFEIPSMGLGVFSCKKSEWLGFNDLFKGFGGEEGYIHEKYRKKGGRCLCLNEFKWMHRFNRPNGVPFPNILEDRCFNYFIARFELEQDYSDVAKHFSEGNLNKKIVQAVFNDAYKAFYKKDPDKLIFTAEELK